MTFQSILNKWIEEYCQRHNYIIMEIDYEQKSVFYYLKNSNIFEDYKSFNYTKIDLFK